MTAETGGRVEVALAEIARREGLAVASAEVWASGSLTAGYYEFGGEGWCVGDGGSGCVAENLIEEDALFMASADPVWALDVLRGDREVLERHVNMPPAVESGDHWCDECVYVWPCPDAARVLDRYAPTP